MVDILDLNKRWVREPLDRWIEEAEENNDLAEAQKLRSCKTVINSLIDELEKNRNENR